MLPGPGGAGAGVVSSSTSSSSFGRSLVYGAAYAPLTSPYAQSAWWGRYFRRGLSFQQWDLEYVFYQLFYSFRAPSKVYKLTQHRKQTKNQWARDDPAFVLVLLGLLAVAAIAFGVAYEYPSPASYAWLVVQAWLNFAVLGGLLSTACWALANKYMRSSVPLPHSVEQEVEWLYAWDVHCNAYVPVLVLLFVVQFFLLHLVLAEGFVATLAANTLYAAALVQYVYVTFSGYLSECAWRGGMEQACGACTPADARAPPCVCAPPLPPQFCHSCNDKTFCWLPWCPS